METDIEKLILKNSMFGDKFMTKGGQRALFLRRSYNSENEFAFLYVEGWGIVQYFQDGRCVDESMIYDIEIYDIDKKVIYFPKDI